MSSATPPVPAATTRIRPADALAAIALSALMAMAAGCATLETHPRPNGRPAAIPEKDRVLHDYRAAAAALRNGRDDEARTRLDDAILRIGGMIADSADARRARSLFAAESAKMFIGEPYERMMAYYYRGILYWRDGEPDNARACFRSGLVIDSDTEQAQYRADYVLLDYLDGLITTKLGGDGSDALRRAMEHAGDRLQLPPYDPAANVLVFVEFGRGPRKYAAGQFGEQLKFAVPDSPARAARLVLDGGNIVVPLPACDDLGFQATTRGGRVMDHILGNKAVFKATTDSAGNLALAGAVIAHDEARRREREGKDGHDADVAAAALGAIGLIGKIAAAATQPRADTRTWDNLPRHLAFAALRLPPGQYRGQVEYLDGSGAVLAGRTHDVTIEVGPGDRDTVVFLSELKR